MVGLRGSLGRVAMLAAVALSLMIFSKDIIRLLSSVSSEQQPIKDIFGVCAALHREMRKNEGRLSGQSEADWKILDCSRHLGNDLESPAVTSPNRTADLDAALRREMVRQRIGSLSEIMAGKVKGGSNASVVTPNTNPVVKGSRISAPSSGGWMDGLKQQVQKELGESTSGRSIGDKSAGPEKTPYVSPFSIEAEQKRKEQLLSSLNMELERQKAGKQMNVVEGARNLTHSPRISPQPSISKSKSPTSAPIGEPDHVKQCRKMKQTYNVLVGYSWGTLSVAGQKMWKDLGCDEVFLSQVIDAKTDEEWCKHVVKRYNIVPLKTWGQLPFDLTETWRAKACDSYFVAQRKNARTETNCSSFQRSPWMSRIPVVRADSEPLIVILAASTTRKIRHPSTKSLALCQYLLTSIVRTVECGFRYAYVLGFDEGDPFFDNPLNMQVQIFILPHRND